MLFCIEYSVAQYWICQQQNFGTIPNFVVFLQTNVQAVAIFHTLNENVLVTQLHFLTT